MKMKRGVRMKVDESGVVVYICDGVFGRWGKGFVSVIKIVLKIVKWKLKSKFFFFIFIKVI